MEEDFITRVDEVLDSQEVLDAVADLLLHYRADSDTHGRYPIAERILWDIRVALVGGGEGD